MYPRYRTFLERIVARSSRKRKREKEEKVRDFRDTLYMATGCSYILQLNIYMIHVYIIIPTCGRNERNMKRSHANTHARGASTSAIFFDARWKGQRFSVPMSREVDLDVIFFRARNRIISRNGLFVCSAAREKRSYRLLAVHAIVFAFCKHVSITCTTRIRKVFRISTYS